MNTPSVVPTPSLTEGSSAHAPPIASSALSVSTNSKGRDTMPSLTRALSMPCIGPRPWTRRPCCDAIPRATSMSQMPQARRTRTLSPQPWVRRDRSPWSQKIGPRPSLRSMNKEPARTRCAVPSSLRNNSKTSLHFPNECYTYSHDRRTTERPPPHPISEYEPKQFQISFPPSNVNSQLYPRSRTMVG
jgi:hypothetical protein